MIVSLGLFLPCYTPALSADSELEQMRIYQTREERRNAGLKHEVTDWLTVSGLLELEAEAQRFALREESSNSHGDDSVATVQLGAELHPLDWFKIESVYEYDTEDEDHLIDEIFASGEVGDTELEFGKLYLPFGVYFSNFVSGPVLEFGETSDEALVLSYGLNDHIEASLFAYQGRARKVDSNNDFDWGLAIEGTLGFGSAGMSFISDLADSNEGLLADEGDRYEQRVRGLSVFAVAGYDRFELTLEMVWALGSFEELDPDRNRPRAWNAELGFYPRGNFEWALRLEGSREIEDEPELRSGFAVAWRITPNASLTLEYLYATYKKGLAEDRQDRQIDYSH